MPDRATIDDFLSQQHLAFVGVSRNPKDFANSVYRHLRNGGRTMYPVNGNATTPTLEGDPCYRRVEDVPDPVDGVIVMVSPRVAATVVEDAIRRGIPRVWLHRGIGRGSVSQEAIRLCEDAGIPVVDGACPLMFDEPVHSIHRLHRRLSSRSVA